MGIEIGRTKFAELRPKHCVFAGTLGTHRVCVCLIHENPDLMIHGSRLSKLTENMEVPLKSAKDCISLMVCDINNPACLLGSMIPEIKCNECPGKSALSSKLLKIFEENEIEELRYKMWTTVDRCEIRTIISPPHEFVTDLCSKLDKLVAHSFITSQQNAFFRAKKENLKEGEALVISDFSENFSFIVQNAPQGFHWTNSSATIHVSVAYYKDKDGKINHISHVVVSDCHKHVTTAVHIYQRKMMPHLGEVMPTPLKKIFYFSDGSAAQYKNKYNYLNLSYHEEEYGVPAEWHHFGTSHGRGVCDAVGGSVKREVTRASLQRISDGHITTPQELYEFIRQHMPKIRFDFVSVQDFENEERFLKKRYKNPKTIRGTQNIHCIIPVQKGVVRTKVYSNSTEAKEHRIQ
ncbi:hypothetical protein B566_EDAN015427 [Ephemera danica]|nr:hypothetical protein B566_EDAN015427 [Ephemera danica]